MVLNTIPNMGIINIVIDTNVIIAALKSKQGASYKLLMSLPDNTFLNNVSMPLFIEYDMRAKIKDHFSLFLSCFNP